MERRKKRIVKLTAFLFLLAASIFAMLAGNEWVSIKDLKIRRDTYDLSFYYGYSPYFPSDTYNRIIAWYGDAYYTGLRITNTFGTPEETKQIFNAVDEKLASIYKLMNNSMTDE